MKKTLLIGLVAMAGVVAQAQEYAYTTFAKVKIVGEELVQNGNFSDVESYAGWTGADGATVDPAAWAFQEALGPDGENVMQSGGTTQEGALVQAVAVEPGTYYVSFQLLGSAGTNASQAVFFNKDGSLIYADGNRVVINANNRTAADWTEVADTVVVNEEGFIVFNLSKFVAEAQVTNFSVKQANVVYDTRALERFAEYANAVVESGYFTSDNADFAGYLDDLNAYLNGEMTADEYGTDFDDPSAGAGEMDGLQSALNEYLNENSADLLVDEKPFNGYGDNRKWNSQGSWTGGTNGRWFSGGNGASKEIPEVVLNWGYGANLPNDQLYYPLVVTQSGTYMFKIESFGHYWNDKNWSAASYNRTTPFRGARFFVGKNKPVVSDGFAAIEGNLWQANDNNDQTNFHPYTFFFDAEEGDTIYCGAQYINDNTTTNKGGLFHLGYPVLRLIGVSQNELDYQKLVGEIKTQQSVLGERIGTANEMVAWQKADGFPWGHAALQLAIDTITPVYNESFNVIDADGNVLDKSRITEEYRDEVLLNAVNSIKRSWQAFESLNAHYTNLLAAIATAQASNDDPLNAAGDHDTFQAVINAAQAIVDGITGDETLEGFTPADCDAAILTLQAAQATFETSTASFSNPSELTIVNGDFSDGNNNNSVVGWTFTANDTNKEQYKRATDANFEGGYRRGVWRGYTVAPTSKLVQTLNLVPAGVYEYRAQAYAANEGKKNTGGGQDQAMWKLIYETVGDGDEAYEQVVDTIFNGNSEVKLFFGLNGAPDSARVKSPYFGHSIAENRTANGYLPQWYSVYYVKASAEEETTEFGMDSFGQAANGANGANYYGFGSNHVFYLGSYSKYLADIKEDLNGQIQAAKNDLGGYGEDHYHLIATMRLAKAVRYAEEAVTTDNLTEIANTRWALLQAMQDRAEALVATSIREVNKDEQQQTAVREGIYNLQGVRMAGDRQALKPGLYIINGKKYFVK
jgi:hypothetical protein